jgi:hypothetical protein
MVFTSPKIQVSILYQIIACFVYLSVEATLWSLGSIERLTEVDTRKCPGDTGQSAGEQNRRFHHI